MYRKRIFQLTLIALTAVALNACQGGFLGRLLGGEGEEPIIPNPANEAAELAAEVVAEAIQDSAPSFDTMLAGGGLDDSVPPGTEFSFTLTEADMLANVNEALANSGYSDRVTVQNVTLADGQIGLFFDVSLPPFEGLAGSAIFDVNIDAAGKPVATVVSAEFGQFDAPPGSLEVLNEAMSELLVSAGEAMVVTSLTIANGQMTISGVTQ